MEPTSFSCGILSFILSSFWSWTTIIRAEQRKYFLLSVYKNAQTETIVLHILIVVLLR